MKAKKTTKPFWEMTAEQREAAIREFDKPIPLSRTRPLTKQERTEFKQMQRSPHRSVYVLRDGCSVVLQLDPDLLSRCSRYAARHKMTLTDVVSRSLRGMLAMVE